MKLISVSQLSNIRKSVQDVIDTFHVTPVEIHIATLASDYMETRGFEKHDILAQIEYLNGQSDTQVTGTINETSLKVSIGYDNAVLANLVDSDGNFKGCIERDSIKVDSIEYKITAIAKDGYLEQKPALIILTANCNVFE